MKDERDSAPQLDKQYDLLVQQKHSDAYNIQIQ